jgi:putative acyl-CoA dehydrogenase
LDAYVPLWTVCQWLLASQPAESGILPEVFAPPAQFYRDIQINTVWEGSGNVVALDILRAAAREPAGVAAFMDECELAEDLALALQASLLVRGAPGEVANAFCASRLGQAGGRAGTLPSGIPAEAIVERALAL